MPHYDYAIKKKNKQTKTTARRARLKENEHFFGYPA